MSKFTNINLYLISEFLFIILPIIILTTVRILDGAFEKIFYNYEWSVASIIFFGQALVRFTSGLSNTNLKTSWQRTALIFALIFVLGLIPVCIILIYNMMANETSLLAYILQLVFFFISTFCFFVFGGVGQSFLEDIE